MTLIDPNYQAQIQSMHRAGKFNNGAKQFRLVDPFIKEYQPRTVLDFGCGKGALMREIQQSFPQINCWGYDPGNPDFAIMPDRTFDAVISTDAIEHIEPRYLDETLSLISDRMGHYGFFRIACHPAKKYLPDGRNCHLTVQSPAWWREKILVRMSVNILWEKIEPFDKRDKHPLLLGHKYDVILEKT